MVERPGQPDDYGPQLVAYRHSYGRRHVLYESGRMFDADFVDPVFIRFPDRTLMLADYGSEDVWAMLVWSIENGRVRDLGDLQVALSDDTDGFIGGAARSARVRLEEGRYVITVPVPLLIDPAGSDEMRIPEGATFVESYGSLQMAHPAVTYSDVRYVEESGDVAGTDLALLIQGEKALGMLRHFEGVEAAPVLMRGTLTGNALELRSPRIEIRAQLSKEAVTGTLSFLIEKQKNASPLNLPRRD